jgi:hypothetical protein
MDGVVAHDARVWAILKTPDEYFARARREAWLHAREDVAADLARRAQRRRYARLATRAPASARG